MRPGREEEKQPGPPISLPLLCPVKHASTLVTTPQCTAAHASTLPKPPRLALTCCTPPDPHLRTPHCQPSPAYKSRLRARFRTHTISSNLLDIIFLPISLSVAVAVDAGEFLGAGGGRWTRRAAATFFASSSSSSPSSTLPPHHRRVLCKPPVSSVLRPGRRPRTDST
jgi:hypothetical protein